MTILDTLLAEISYDETIRSVLVGAHWTAVCSRWGAVNSLLSQNSLGKDQESYRKARRLARIFIPTPPLDTKRPPSGEIRTIPLSCQKQGRMSEKYAAWQPERGGRYFMGGAFLSRR